MRSALLLAVARQQQRRRTRRGDPAPAARGPRVPDARPPGRRGRALAALRAASGRARPALTTAAAPGTPDRRRAVSSQRLESIPAPLGARSEPPLLLGALAADSASPADEPPRFVLGASLSALEPTQDRDLREAELLYAFLTASYRREGRVGRSRGPARATEGLSRPYFKGSVWVEEAYGLDRDSGRPGPGSGGSAERVRARDDPALGGSLFSDNGVKRNPDWGSDRRVAAARLEHAGVGAPVGRARTTGSPGNRKERESNRIRLRGSATASPGASPSSSTGGSGRSARACRGGRPGSSRRTGGRSTVGATARPT